MEKQIVILGAGAAGLGANYSLKQKGYNPIVLEKDETYGGLWAQLQISVAYFCSIGLYFLV